MFDLAWSHILLIGVVALLVIGPKDLPRVLRTLGVWVGRARAIARDFQGSVDQMIREAELEEVRKEVEQAATVDLDHNIENTIDPGGEIKQGFAAPAASEPPATATIEAQPAPDATSPAQSGGAPGESAAEAAVPVQEASAPEESAAAPAEGAGLPEAGEADAEPVTEPAAVPKSGTHD
jgi:sec-independent protein translocase protein TatB